MCVGDSSDISDGEELLWNGKWSFIFADLFSF